MEKITEVGLKDINKIVAEIVQSNFVCSRFLEQLDGEVEFSEENSQIIIRNVSRNIYTVIIGCEDAKIKSVFFNGLLYVTAQEIVDSYGEFKEHYSTYDDLYFYAFLFKSKSINYIISFFNPSHQKIDFQENGHLSNISLEFIDNIESD